MTKQEKIDWLVRDFLAKAFNCEENEYLFEMSLKLRKLLAKKGVMVKVNDHYEELIDATRKGFMGEVQQFSVRKCIDCYNL